MNTHPTAGKLLEMARTSRAASSNGLPEEIRRLRSVIETCPTFVPALLGLGRILQIADEKDDTSNDPFESAERMLRAAVEASDRGPETLIELAFFLNAIRAQPAAARELFVEASNKLEQQLEETWAALISLHGECGMDEESSALASRAMQAFPDSAKIALAHEFERRR